MSKKIDQLVKVLRHGGVIIYPTEGVYGLGCDPFNETAVLRLLKIKGRQKKNKGLIVIAANWEQVKKLIKMKLEKRRLNKISGETPTTIVFPATNNTPVWIRGRFKSIAIRITTHPLAKNICRQFGGPIVSTSANLTGQKPARKFDQICKKVVAAADFVVRDRVGNLRKPTRIVDIKTEKIIRC